MLRVIKSSREIPWDQLSCVYGGEVDRAFLGRGFFNEPGAAIYLWTVGDAAVSALRVERWMDGVLITALQTAEGCRNRGYARMLLSAALEHLGQQGSGRTYAHIHHRNRASVCVHEKCGFRMIADTARLLDGTVTAQMGTYLREIP